MAENEKEEEREAKVTTTEDILKASGNDELKFGLLIGLIKVGQVSNKDVVDTVLYLVSILGIHIHHPSEAVVSLYNVNRYN